MVAFIRSRLRLATPRQDGEVNATLSRQPTGILDIRNAYEPLIHTSTVVLLQNVASLSALKTLFENGEEQVQFHLLKHLLRRFVEERANFDWSGAV